LPRPVTAGNFNTNGPFPITIYTYGGFTFELLGIANREDQSLSPGYDFFQFYDGLILTMQGMVSGNGFDPTPFTARWSANGFCSGTYGPPTTCTSDLTASWSVHIEALGNGLPELSVAKTPDGGRFAPRADVSYRIMVTNPAAVAAGSATHVTLTDQLPGNGGLVWSNVSTSQGTCTLAGNLLSCALGTIAPQTSVMVEVSSSGGTPAAACQPQPNPVARVTADGGLSAEDSGSLSCIPPQLAIVKTPDNGNFLRGERVAFTIVVSNPAAEGAEPARLVTLTDQLPGNGGLVWSNVSTSPGVFCDTPIVGNRLRCNLGDIAAQSAKTVTVSSASSTPASACQLQPNPVALAEANGGSLSAQDSGSLTCDPSVPAPQLSIVKTPDFGTFQPGAQVAFTIVVRNPAPAGSGSANNVTLTDELPGNGGLVWSNVSTSQGTCTILGNFLRCALGTIAPQSSVTVQVSSAASTPAAACQLQPNALALVTASGGLSAQDSGSLTCTPTTPQLTIEKTPDNGTFEPGAQVVFTIVVSNPAAVGGGSATNVMLTDQLPGNGGLVWSNVSTSQGSCVTPIFGNLLDCNLGTIPAQGAATIVVSSPPTTPASACRRQPNPVALATGDGGLATQDSGSLDCTLPVNEFYNTLLDHYFLTADPVEAESIDAGGSGPGWTRTGHTFKSGGSNAACRFRGVPAAGGPNGHFYTADPDECEQVKGDPGWHFESLDFSITPPNPGGVCPDGLADVFRAYNKRFAQHDSNHRITADFTAYQAQVALGWVGEGVVMCAEP
jgi:uncharacterized repeat protein (TIGR01451 family)